MKNNLCKGENRKPLGIHWVELKRYFLSLDQWSRNYRGFLVLLNHCIKIKTPLYYGLSDLEEILGGLYPPIFNIEFLKNKNIIII